jgi:ABC-2 type transport system ATP-binding protein
VVGKRNEGLLVRAEPLEWAKEISKRMVDVVRLEDGALLLEVDPQRAGAINTVLVMKGVRVDELRKQSTAAAGLLA